MISQKAVSRGGKQRLTRRQRLGERLCELVDVWLFHTKRNIGWLSRAIRMKRTQLYRAYRCRACEEHTLQKVEDYVQQTLRGW